MPRSAKIDEEDVSVHVQRVEWLARLMDDAVQVPGTKYRVGLDGVVGLFPVVGDAVSLATNAYVVYTAERLGVPRRIVAQMVLNAALDFAAGSLPLVGDLFDFAFKSHRRNVQLLRRAILQQHVRPSHRPHHHPDPRDSRTSRGHVM